MQYKSIKILGLALAGMLMAGSALAAEFNGTVTIHNNTKYTIKAMPVKKGPVTCEAIASGGTCTYVFAEDQPNVFNTVEPTVDMGSGVTVAGNLSFSPTGGLYVDRGWMENQTIKLTTSYTGTESGTHTQEENGAALNKWSVNIMKGGSVTLTYSDK